MRYIVIQDFIAICQCDSGKIKILKGSVISFENGIFRVTKDNKEWPCTFKAFVKPEWIDKYDEEKQQIQDNKVM